MSHPPKTEPNVIEVVLCRDHFERLGAGKPCENCPSLPENRSRSLTRAAQYEIGYHHEVREAHAEQSAVLREILAALRRFNMVYLALASICIMAILGFLLWNGKIEDKFFYAFSAFVLSPFYGPGLGAILREFTGIKTKTGNIIGVIIGTIAIELVTAAIL